MTKKDYQALARAFYGTRARYARNAQEDSVMAQQWRDCVIAVSDVLAADNPRFIRDRFLEACETGKTRGMRGER